MSDIIDGPRIDPRSVDALPKPVSETITRLRRVEVLSSTTSVRIWAHRPKHAVAWMELTELFYTDTVLDERLRELIRLRVAAVTNCEVCRLSRKSDTVTEADVACIVGDDPRFTKAELAAMDYAARLAGDHYTISDATYAALKAEFSDEQIVEINMFAALMIAGGRMTYGLKAY